MAMTEMMKRRRRASSIDDDAHNYGVFLDYCGALAYLNCGIEAIDALLMANPDSKLSDALASVRNAVAGLDKFIPTKADDEIR